MGVVSTIRIRSVNINTERASALEIERSTLHTRAYILLLVTWQVAIVGILNITSATLSLSVLGLLVDYASAILYFVCSYKLVSLADSAKQDGGYKPVNFFGYPRSRRLIFAFFGGSSIIGPLTIMSLEDSLASSGWRPVALQSSQACLLMVAILSVMSAGLIYQRYRNVATRNRRYSVKILGIILFFLICAAGIQQITTVRLFSEKIA